MDIESNLLVYVIINAFCIKITSYHNLSSITNIAKINHKYSNTTSKKCWITLNGQFRSTWNIRHKTQKEYKQNKEHNTKNLKEEQHRPTKKRCLTGCLECGNYHRYK